MFVFFTIYILIWFLLLLQWRYVLLMKYFRFSLYIFNDTHSYLASKNWTIWETMIHESVRCLDIDGGVLFKAETYLLIGKERFSLLSPT